jgi:hypothetical protein
MEPAAVCSRVLAAQVTVWMDRNCRPPQTFVISVWPLCSEELGASAVGQSRRGKSNGPQQRTGRNISVFTEAILSFKKGD